MTWYDYIGCLIRVTFYRSSANPSLALIYDLISEDFFWEKDTYKAVQPLGLIAVPLNSGFLYDEIYQIVVKSKLEFHYKNV